MISYIKEGKVTIYKRPRAAHLIRFNAPDDTKAIMGHTRMATQGDKKHNYNNHPFVGTAGDTAFSFAHNGVLWNDRVLRKDKLIPDTHIETDSYAACQLIETQNKLDFDSLKYMAETVEGNFTFTILDDENSLYIVKGSNPMCLLHFEALGIYIYASTESIMKNALKKVGFHKFDAEKVEVVEGIYLKSTKTELFQEQSLNISQLQAVLVGTIPLTITPYTKNCSLHIAAVMVWTALMWNFFLTTAILLTKLKICLWTQTCSTKRSGLSDLRSVKTCMRDIVVYSDYT